MRSKRRFLLAIIYDAPVYSQPIGTKSTGLHGIPVSPFHIIDAPTQPRTRVHTTAMTTMAYKKQHDTQHTCCTQCTRQVAPASVNVALRIIDTYASLADPQQPSAADASAQLVEVATIQKPISRCVHYELHNEVWPTSDWCFITLACLG